MLDRFGPATPARVAAPLRRLAVVVGVVMAAAALWFVAPTAARAHTDLVSSVPADGGVVDSVPAEVSLVFSEDLDTTGLQVALTTADGGTVADLPASRVERTTLVQPLPASTAVGGYTLAYRVVSVDGHPVGGTISFTVAAAAASTPPVPTSPTATTPAATSVTTTSVTTTPVTTTPAASTDDGNGPAWWVPVGAAVLIAGAVGAGTRLRRRIGRAGPGSP